QSVEKETYRKKLHKTEEMHMPAGSGHGVSKGSLAACGPRFFVLIVRAGRGGAGFRALRSATKALPLESAIV
ncbi:MAG: hypothetical protein PUC47_02900, partial [Oscillospiraceae bacterium]|nr:hypothetical protein [Oscillospiraceae bacterium]